MGLDVTYKGSQIAKLTEDGNLTLETAGKYCEGDIELSCHPNVGRYWKPPAEWPDLSSIELPTDDTENTIYLLYDKSLGFDLVSIGRRIASGTLTAYKGTIVNGAFVGDQFSTGSVTDTLTDHFTVYKLVGTYTGLVFDYAGSYAKSVQACVWIRGNGPLLSVYGNPFLNTVSVELYNCKSLQYTDSGDDPTYGSLKKFWVGYDKNGNFNGATINRTGNGPMFYQPIGDEDTVTIENVTFTQILMGAFTRMTNVAFKNVVANFTVQRFQNGTQLRSVSFLTSGCTCSSMYLQFSGCSYLEFCDLSNLDFSSATSSNGAFNGCNILKTLKLNSTWAMDLPLNQCYRLTKESIIDIFNTLPTISGAKTITLPYTLKNYLLSDAEKAIATTKGWTIA